MLWSGSGRGLGGAGLWGLLSESPGECPLFQTLETAGYVKSVLVSTLGTAGPHALSGALFPGPLCPWLLPGQTRGRASSQVDFVATALPAPRLCRGDRERPPVRGPPALLSTESLIQAEVGGPSSLGPSPHRGSPALPACTHGLGLVGSVTVTKMQPRSPRAAGHWPPYTFRGSMLTSVGSTCAGICSEDAGAHPSPRVPFLFLPLKSPAPHVGPPAKHHRKRSWGADECGELSHPNRPGTPPARGVGTSCPHLQAPRAGRGLSVFMSVWPVCQPVYTHPC